MKLSRPAVLLTGSTVLAIAALFLRFGTPWFSEQEYRSFPSPDGKYRVVVYRQSTFPSLMPGQSGDAPGKVKLRDRHDKVLQEARVEMVQLVDRVDWEPRKVVVKLVADWDLPGE